MFDHPADEYKQRANQYLDATRDAFVFDAASSIYKPKGYYEQQQHSTLNKLWNNFREHWATIILNALTLFFLIRYTNYTQRLWVEAKRTANESLRSASAAASSAETASDSLHDAKDSFQVQNRPYVIITNGGTAGFVHNQNVFDLSKTNLTYGNIGKTPAYDAFMFVNFIIARFSKDHPRTLNAAIEEAFKPIAKDEANISSYYNELEKMDLPPGANSPFVTTELKNGPLSETDKIKLGQTPSEVLLLCTGRIHYKAFDRTRSYTTDFCFFYFGTNPLIWHYCPTHNLIR